MKRIKNVTVSTMKFVERHKIGFTVLGTAAVCYKFHRDTVFEWNDFLAKHDLLDEYYKLED